MKENVKQLLPIRLVAVRLSPTLWEAVALEMNLRAEGEDADKALSNLWSKVFSHYQAICKSDSWVNLFTPADRRYFKIYETAKIEEKTTVELQITEDKCDKLGVALAEYGRRAPYPEYPLLLALERVKDPITGHYLDP